MKPFLFRYKSITVSWFIGFAVLLIGLSSFIVRIMAKEYEEDKEKIDDIFFSLLIVGFIGGRASYVIANFNLYRGNILGIFSLSHYNISLIAGVVIGVLSLLIFSRVYKIEFQSLLKIFVIPFYFSMSIGIWLVVFDKFLLPFRISNNPIKILYISMIFLGGMLLEFILSKKDQYKYTSPIILTMLMFLYYII